jgi:hypothetical protein
MAAHVELKTHLDLRLIVRNVHCPQILHLVKAYCKFLLSSAATAFFEMTMRSHHQKLIERLNH